MNSNNTEHGIVFIACVASFSIRFWIKEQGTKVKERGGVGEERKEGLADKPREFESCPHGLSCLSAHTDI